MPFDVQFWQEKKPKMHVLSKIIIFGQSLLQM